MLTPPETASAATRSISQLISLAYWVYPRAVAATANTARRAALVSDEVTLCTLAHGVESSTAFNAGNTGH